MLSPPHHPWRIIASFRLHGRRELSHLRRSGAWSSSGRRFDIPSPGVATGEEGGTKLDRLLHSGFETGAARRPSKSPRAGRHGCLTYLTAQTGIRRRPAHLPNRGGPLKPPAARRVEILVLLAPQFLGQEVENQANSPAGGPAASIAATGWSTASRVSRSGCRWCRRGIIIEVEARARTIHPRHPDASQDLAPASAEPGLSRSRLSSG